MDHADNWQSLWRDEALRTSPATNEGKGAPPSPRLGGDSSADVVIVGAGITGLTAALELVRHGREVLVIEASRVGAGESLQTTAHLTECLDLRFADLIGRFGENAARQAVADSRRAIRHIEETVRILEAACGFARVSGYLYADTGDDAQARTLEKEIGAASTLGVGVPDTSVPLPYAVKGALRLDHQAQMTPGPYLDALAGAFVERGGRLVEMTRVQQIKPEDKREAGQRNGHGKEARFHVVTEHGTVTTAHVLLASHSAIQGGLSLQTKLSPWRSYAVACPCDRSTAPGLFWDLQDPYHYVRSVQSGPRRYLIVGGEDHKVGEEPADPTAPWKRLCEIVEQRFGLGPITHRWSGQILASADGLPYIGPSASSNRIFVATGYAGNGITHGTLAGLMFVDAVLDAENAKTTADDDKHDQGAALYEPGRVPAAGAVPHFLKENFGVAKHFVVDRLKSSNAQIEDLRQGEGAVVSHGGRKLAVCRDRDGQLHALSPVCTHLGCYVRWNGAEASWDCPCHGSRFDPSGRVLNGPATEDLKAKPLDDDTEDEAAPIPMVPAEMA